jgi:hypothetical protein
VANQICNTAQRFKRAGKNVNGAARNSDVPGEK